MKKIKKTWNIIGWAIVITIELANFMLVAFGLPTLFLFFFYVCVGTGFIDGTSKAYHFMGNLLIMSSNVDPKTVSKAYFSITKDTLIIKIISEVVDLALKSSGKYSLALLRKKTLGNEKFHLQIAVVIGITLLILSMLKYIIVTFA